MIIMLMVCWYMFLNASVKMELGSMQSEEDENAKKALLTKRVRNRWWKLLTLLNNPTLVLDMEAARIRTHLKLGQVQVGTRI